MINITFNDTIYHCSYVAGTTGWGMEVEKQGGEQGRKGDKKGERLGKGQDWVTVSVQIRLRVRLGHGYDY